MAAGKKAHSELQIDPELMKKLRSVVERRDEIHNLIAKADSAKMKVKPTIYEKVLQDYHARLKEIEGELAPLSDQISQALVEIEKREKEIKSRLQEVDDDIEEQRFRCEVGEFNQKDLEPAVKEMTALREDLTAQIEIVEATYKDCAACLGQAKEPSAPKAIVLDKPVSEQKPVASAELIAPSRKSPPPPPEEATRPDIRVLSKPEPTPAAVTEPEAKPLGDAKPKPVEPQPQAKPSEAKTGPTKPEDKPPAKPAAAKPAAAKPAAAPQSAGFCIKLTKKDGESELFPLKSDKLSIGRSTKSDIVLKVAGVSRTHAQVVRTDGGDWAIIDTSGGGGVAVNGKKQKKSPLKSGDRITIASVEMEVVPA